MVRIFFDTADGKRIEADVPPDRTLMQAARDHDIPGIDADCGGFMACGTCHVIIDPSWHDKLPLQTEAERDMLEYVPDPEPNARLSCQIPITAQLDGIVLRVPKHQR
jgi:ferredoxin, 2Fe-2S